jgi:hypothetical protein
MFDAVVEASTIKSWVVFKTFCNNKQKQLIKIIKSNELVNVMSDGVDFAVIVNEDVFDKLTPEYQNIALVESIGGISVSESDVLSKNPPDFTTHTGVLTKFGDSKVIAFKESVASIYDAIKEEEARAKAERSTKRGRPAKAK